MRPLRRRPAAEQGHGRYGERIGVDGRLREKLTQPAATRAADVARAADSDVRRIGPLVGLEAQRHESPLDDAVQRRQGGQIATNAGCNQMNGAYTLDNATLLVRQMSQTLQGCPDDLNAQDQWLLTLLESQPRLSLEGEELTMQGPDVTVVFDRTSP